MNNKEIEEREEIITVAIESDIDKDGCISFFVLISELSCTRRECALKGLSRFSIPIDSEVGFLDIR